MLLCIRYHKNSCGRFEKFGAWSLPSLRRGDIITGNTKYIKQSVSGKWFSNLNLKTESLILIANCIIAFSCFTINEMNFSPDCSFLGKATWSAESTLKAEPGAPTKARVFWGHRTPLIPSGLGRLKSFAWKKIVEYAILLDVWILSWQDFLFFGTTKTNYHVSPVNKQEN